MSERCVSAPYNIVSKPRIHFTCCMCCQCTCDSKTYLQELPQKLVAGKNNCQMLKQACYASGHNPGTEVLQIMARDAESKVTKFTAQNISNTVLAYAKLEHHPGHLMEVMAAEALTKLDSFNSQVSFFSSHVHVNKVRSVALSTTRSDSHHEMRNRLRCDGTSLALRLARTFKCVHMYSKKRCSHQHPGLLLKW